MTESESVMALALTLENDRLRSQLSARFDELRACRGRVADAIYAERRRIERDLHDGTQGRLVSLAMSLGLLEAKLPTDPDAARPIVREAREVLAVALAELRELSSGIYPGVLAERGLAAALQDLADRAALPTQVDLSLNSRLPPQVEAAAYFVVSEALTNALKHSHAREIRIAATRKRARLTVEVADNGIGGAMTAGGSGLPGLADRVEALGGTLILSSPPGQGTTVTAEIPSRLTRSPGLDRSASSSAEYTTPPGQRAAAQLTVATSPPAPEEPEGCDGPTSDRLIQIEPSTT